jgi:hypothetical protein
MNDIDLVGATERLLKAIEAGKDDEVSLLKIFTRSS